MPTLIRWLPSRVIPTFEWMTDVLDGADGSDQRIPLWIYPRLGISMDFDMVGDGLDGDTEKARRSLRELLFTLPTEYFEIPLRFESSFLRADLAQDATTVEVDWLYTADWIQAGGRVYIEDDENELGYAATVLSLEDDGDVTTLTLDIGAPQDFSASSTRISPIVDFKPDDKQALGRYRVEHGTWTMSGSVQTYYLFNPGQDISLTVHNEAYVLEAEAQQPGTAQIGEEFDAGLEIHGAPKLQVTSIYPASRIRRDLTFKVSGPDEWRYWKKFLFSVRGQQVPFYRSTFRDDLVLVSQPSSPSSTLLVEDAPDYNALTLNVDTYVCLALTLSSGTVLYVRASSASNNFDGTRTITMSAPFSRGSATIDKVSFLEATRLAEDTAQITVLKGDELLIDLKTITGDWIEVSAPPIFT